MAILLPNGPLSQLSSLWFVSVALVTDVLLIRLFLCLAYIFVLAAAALGIPKWPSVADTGNVALDTLTWSCVGLAFHLNAFLQLVWDERPITFASDDEEQLWRLFLRRGGMGRLEMKQALKHGRWVRVRAGEVFARGAEARLHFYVVVKGRVSVMSVYRGRLPEPKTLWSGTCFDMGLLSAFGVFNGLVKNEGHTFWARADTDCLLYSWSVDELAAIATQTAPAVGAHFRNFTLAQLGMFLGHRLYPNQEIVCATGELEPEGILEGKVRSRDFTDPLRPYEQQKRTVKGTIAWLKRSFNPIPPAGLRHTALPITGILARNRLVAVKAAKCQAALQQAAEAASSWSDEELASRASSVTHEGATALDILNRMQSLEELDLATVGAVLEEASVRCGAHGRKVLSAPATPVKGRVTEDC